MQSAKDLKIAKSDFILEHKKLKFQQMYKTESDQIIGQGGFGTVMKCQHLTTNETRAVKIMKKNNISKEEQVRLHYEIDILKNLDHPNILKLYEVFEDKNSLYLVTEYCDGGELFDAILAKGSFNERDAASVLK